jgi:dTMP kinase
MNGSHPPVFVVFEGLDGSGKSTCARLVADQLDAVFMTTPSPSVRAYRDDLIASFAGNQEAAQLFYLATVFDASGRVGRYIDAGQSVVLDRYFLSTQAYAAFRGSSLRVDGIGDLLRPPDLTVFLDVPLEVRRERLAARGTTTADRETLTHEADARLLVEHRVRSQFESVGTYLEVDGTLAPEVIVARVLAVPGARPLRARSWSQDSAT